MIKKVFASLPMNGRDISEIKADMSQMLAIVESEFLDNYSDSEFELIDTVLEDEPATETNNEGCWYLGRSVTLLSTADLVIFHPAWREARGCIIEHMICAMYNIPYIDISMKYDFDGVEDDVQDYTHDWNVAGEVNEKLSEAVAEAEGLNDILDVAHDDIAEELMDPSVIQRELDRIVNEVDALGLEDDVDELVDSDPDFELAHEDFSHGVSDEPEVPDKVVQKVLRYLNKHKNNPHVLDELGIQLEPGEYDADA